MESYYKNIENQKILFKGPKKIIALVKAANPIPDMPSYFILKSFPLSHPPKELYIHKELSEFDSNILKLYTSWQDNTNHYICVEFCNHKDLHSLYISESLKPDSFLQILQNCLQLALNLCTMHNLNITHNRISCSKVLKTSQNTLKLAGFSHSKKQTHALNQHLNKSDMNSSFKFSNSNPFRNDLKALGRVFSEIALGRICSELEQISANRLQEHLKVQFELHKYPERFMSLVFQMLADDSSPNLVVGQVIDEIRSIYENKMSEPEVYDSVRDKFGVDPRNYSLHLHDEPLPEMSEVDLERDIVIQITEEDESGLSNSDMNITGVYDNEEEIEITPRVNFFEEFKAVGGEYDFLYDGKETPLLRNSEERLENSVKSSSLNGKVQISVESSEDGIKHQIELSMDQQDSVMIKPPKNCRKCLRELDEQSVELLCKHSYHKDCLKQEIENILIAGSSIKIEPIKCPVVECREYIGFDTFLYRCDLGKKLREVAFKQLYANIPFFCEECKEEKPQMFLLTKKLKPVDIRCENCGTKHCSFCGARGGHRFFCDLFKDAMKENENQIYERYKKHIKGINLSNNI